MINIEKNGEVRIPNGSIDSVSIHNGLDVFLIIGDDCKLEMAVGSSTVHTKIGKNSVVKIRSFSKKGETKLFTLLEGDNSEVNEKHVFFAENDVVKISTTLTHAGKNTRGNVLMRGVSKNTAELYGKIKIEKTGSGTQSYLTQRTLLLDNGRANATPELEIDNNDVSTKHSSSVMKINDETLFYLQSRGLGEKEVKDLIIHGWIEEG